MLRAWLILEEINERSVITSMLMQQMLKHLVWASQNWDRLNYFDKYKNSFAFSSNMQHKLTLQWSYIYIYIYLVYSTVSDIYRNSSSKIKVLPSFTHPPNLHYHRTDCFNDTIMKCENSACIHSNGTVYWSVFCILQKKNKQYTIKGGSYWI